MKNVIAAALIAMTATSASAESLFDKAISNLAAALPEFKEANVVYRGIDVRDVVDNWFGSSRSQLQRAGMYCIDKVNVQTIKSDNIFKEDTQRIWHGVSRCSFDQSSVKEGMMDTTQILLEWQQGEPVALYVGCALTETCKMSQREVAADLYRADQIGDKVLSRYSTEYYITVTTSGRKNETADEAPMKLEIHDGLFIKFLLPRKL